jgi:hypothetical protein
MGEPTPQQAWLERRREYERDMRHQRRKWAWGELDPVLQEEWHARLERRQEARDRRTQLTARNESWLMLHLDGFSITEIARFAGFCRATVANAVRDPQIQYRVYRALVALREPASHERRFDD